MVKPSKLRYQVFASRQCESARSEKSDRDRAERCGGIKNGEREKIFDHFQYSFRYHEGRWVRVARKLYEWPGEYVSPVNFSN